MYFFLALVGVGLACAAWFPWRKRHPLVALRIALIALVCGATGLAMWAAHEATEAANAGAAAGDGFGNIRVH